MTNYWEKIELDSTDMTEQAKKTRQENYLKSHELRNFEITLFWQRASYYWAFILAAYTAHFALASFLFSKTEDCTFSISKIYKLSGLSVFALILSAFICYFFSLCWVIMNKGSKFWQINWEKHIDELEYEFSGNLYKVIPDTNNKESFKSCPLSLAPYNYSVTKVTGITACVLLILSFAIFMFYSFILVTKIFNINLDLKNCHFLKWIALALIILAFLFSLCICAACIGNSKEKHLLKRLILLFKPNKNDGYWINREEQK